MARLIIRAARSRFFSSWRPLKLYFHLPIHLIFGQAIEQRILVVPMLYWNLPNPANHASVA